MLFYMMSHCYYSTFNLKYQRIIGKENEKAAKQSNGFRLVDDMR